MKNYNIMKYYTLEFEHMAYEMLTPKLFLEPLIQIDAILQSC